MKTQTPYDTVYEKKGLYMQVLYQLSIYQFVVIVIQLVTTHQTYTNKTNKIKTKTKIKTKKGKENKQKQDQNK